jgi:6-phosphogluconolactonase
MHYLLDEDAEGRVSTVSSEAGWKRRASSPTMGKDPCHAALDADQSCLAVANYGSGSIALFRLDPATGIPILPPALRQNSGRGPNTARQAGPHAHWVGFSPDGRWLHSIDLGTDAILGYPFDRKAKTIGTSYIAYRAPAGSGPRHIAFHPFLRAAYLVSELANSVTHLRPIGEGRFEAVRILSTLRPDFTSHSQAAHIAINRTGTRLYVSNRGENSIAIFAIDRDGGLAPLQHMASGGDWPRFLLLLEECDRVIVANERSGTLVSFAIAADGTIRPTSAALRVPGAVFLGRAKRG